MSNTGGGGVIPVDIEDKVGAGLDAAFGDGITPETSPEAPPPPPPAEAAPAEAAPATPSTSPALPTFDPSPYSKDVQDLLARHGGDLNKAGAEYFRAQNSAAAEIKRLKAQLREFQSTPQPSATPGQPQPQATPSAQPAATPAELAQIDGSIQGLEREFQVVEQYRTQITQEAQQLDQQRATAQQDLTGLLDRLATGDPYTTDLAVIRTEATRVRAALSQLDAKRQQLDYNYREANLQRNLLIRDYGIQKQLRDTTARTLSYVQARESDQRERLQADLSGFRDSYLGAAEASGKAVGIPDSLLPRFVQYARMAGLDYTSVLNEDGEYQRIDDLQTFTESLAKSYLEDLDSHHRARAAQYAAQKTADATPRTPTGSRVAPPTPAAGPRFKSVEDLEAHLDAEFERQLG